MSAPVQSDKGIDYARHGFYNPGFGCTVRRTEISVHIVVTRSGLIGHGFGVYVCHGSPGGPFWRNNEPLVRAGSLEEARGKAETIFGIAGSGKFAAVHDETSL